MNMKKMILAAISVAIGVVLSTASIPVGPAKVFPVQHMINVILAVLVGSRYNVSAAFCTSVLRNALALGSPLAFPGSMIGAYLSSVLYARSKQVWMAVVGEVVGTGILGAVVSYPIANYLLGKQLALLTLATSFTVSSAAGAYIGFCIVFLLERYGARVKVQ